MIHFVGYGLVILSAWFLYKTIKAPQRKRGSKMQLLPLYVILFFITAVASISLIFGDKLSRVSISVTGAPDDASVYQKLVDKMGHDYKFTVLNIYGKPAGAVEAVSCNEAVLNAFVDKSKEVAMIVFIKKSPTKCAEMSAISNFIHPHINLYLR